MAPHDVTHLIPLAQTNIAETPVILSQHVNTGGTSSAAVLTEADIPPRLDPGDCPSFPTTTIRVVPEDLLNAAISILDAAAEDEDAPIARGKTVVLNSCSDKCPGGQYSSLVGGGSGGAPVSPPTSPGGLTGVSCDTTTQITQEESLCLATTLYTTLKPEWYPWPNVGEKCVRGIYSPGVVIFRNPETLQMIPEPEDRHVVSILSLAAPSNRPLDESGSTFADPQDLEYLRRKLRFWLRAAAMNGQERLVLGAWGCGSHKCPRRLVAEEMKAALAEPEFKGWFYDVVFAIKPREKSEEGSYAIFREVLDGVVL